MTIAVGTTVITTVTDGTIKTRAILSRFFRAASTTPLGGIDRYDGHLSRPSLETARGAKKTGDLSSP
jgi:hypothetical protein